MIYAIQKNASGTVESVYAWTDDNQPIPTGCVACTEAEYTAVKSTLVNSLQAHAAVAESWIQTQALLAYAGQKVFTAAMNTYVAAITAIANGTDTTSTALPTQPADVMETEASNATVSGTSITDTGTSSTTTAATSSAVTAK